MVNTRYKHWPRNTMWQHRSGATLAQVMACCLTAPSHYLTQCWLIISKVQWHSSESNFKEIHQLSTTKINLKITHRKFRSNLPGPKDLNWANRAPFTQFLGYELHLCVLPCFQQILWNIFPCYWPFVRESTGHRWIPLKKASDGGLWCFLWSTP